VWLSTRHWEDFPASRPGPFGYRSSLDPTRNNAFIGVRHSQIFARHDTAVLTLQDTATWYTSPKSDLGFWGFKQIIGNRTPSDLFILDLKKLGFSWTFRKTEALARRRSYIVLKQNLSHKANTSMLPVCPPTQTIRGFLKTYTGLGGHWFCLYYWRELGIDVGPYSYLVNSNLVWCISYRTSPKHIGSHRDPGITCSKKGNRPNSTIISYGDESLWGQQQRHWTRSRNCQAKSGREGDILRVEGIDLTASGDGSR